MRNVCLALVGLACVVDGRRRHSLTQLLQGRGHLQSSEQLWLVTKNARVFLDPLSALAMLFLAFNKGARPLRIANMGEVGKLLFAHQSRRGLMLDMRAETAPVEPEPDEKADELLVEMDLLLTFALNLQDERNWELLQKKTMQFSDIAHSAYIAPSSRHGTGVFASRNIEKDVIVSFYPVHGIGWREQEATMRFLHRKEDIDFYKDRSSNTSYVMEVIQESGSFIDVDLEDADVQGWLSHRLNDAAVCTGTDEEAILQYLETCAHSCNCATVPFGAVPIMAAVTTRAVQKGEELLCSYGHNYWIKQAGSEVAPDMLTEAVANTSRYEEDKVDIISRLMQRYKDEAAYFKKLLQRHFVSPKPWRRLWVRRQGQKKKAVRSWVVDSINDGEYVEGYEFYDDGEEEEEEEEDEEEEEEEDEEEDAQ